MTERADKIEELGLRVQPFVDNCEKVPRLRAQLAARDMDPSSKRVAALRPTKTLDALTPNHALMREELNTPHVAERRRRGLLRAFVEIVCTGSSDFTRTQATIFLLPTECCIGGRAVEGRVCPKMSHTCW